MSGSKTKCVVPHHEAVGDQRKALGKMKDRVRQISGRQGGRRLPDVIEKLRSYLMGWRNYFDLASTPQVLANLDQWIRRRLRALQLKQWKRGRTIFRELRARGASVDVAAQVAANAQRWWRSARMPGGVGGEPVRELLTGPYPDSG